MIDATMMTERLALRLAIFFATGLTAASCLADDATRSAPRVEMRGVWLQPYAVTDDVRDQTIDKVMRAHFNTVFLRAPSIVSAHGVNHGTGNERDFRATLDALAKRGVSVHAWITNKTRDGGDQVDFTHAEERARQARWAVDVMSRYPKLDGVHFDYIRYTDWANPDAKKIDAITETLRLTREMLRRHHPGSRLTAAVFPAKYSYLGGAWRGEKITWDGDVPAWFQRWYALHDGGPYATDPLTLHRAGRFAEYKPKHRYGPTFFHVQQDPPRWLALGVVDAVMPMQYSSEAATFETDVRCWSAMIRPPRSVYMGLGWLTERGQPEWRRDAPALVRHIAFARAHGVTGFSVFTLSVPKTDDEPLIKALSGPGGPFAAPAVSPLRRSFAGRKN